MTDGASHLAFDRLTERAGMAVIDRIEHQRYDVYTADPVSPMPVSPDSFYFPVERAVEFTTRELQLPFVTIIRVRNSEGVGLVEPGHDDSIALPTGSYILELSAQLKTYIEVDGAIEITTDSDTTTIAFDAPVTVHMGIRSHHDRPAGTVTTTTDPADVMAAIETFGSALTETSPERSFPSLRGHPPAVELGDELDIPGELEGPSTGVTLELPLQYDALYVAAPLAYYLGADLEPGPSPKLVTESGFEHSFSSPAGYETEMIRTLKQLFTLDCVTRTEGLFEFPLHEREAIEPLVDLDFERLYAQPLHEQVEAYLDVPYEVVEEFVPEWRLAVHAEPTVDSLELLPFIVDDLAVVRSSGGSPAHASPAGQAGQAPDTATGFTRSAGEGSTADSAPTTRPTPADARERAWVGSDVPVGASKLTAAAFHNRLDRSPTEGDISIAIVVNDERMDEEGAVVDRIYAAQDELPFDVAVHRETTVAQLRDILAEETGFLHYIGHVDADGFDCADGTLDAADLTETGVEAFCLNACNSYDQGLALVEAGAIGGIVTLQELANERAVRMGDTLARLLDVGFPLRTALDIAQGEHLDGDPYIVVGDGGVSVAQCPSRAPNVLAVERAEDGFELEVTSFLTEDTGLGSVFKPHLAAVEHCFLTASTVGPLSLTEDDFEEFLNLQEVPVQGADGLAWSTSLDVTDL